MDSQQVSQPHGPEADEDRLSDSLTLQIVSSFEMRDAVRTTTRNKRWITVPCLDSWLRVRENVRWRHLRSLTIEGPKSVSGDAMHRILSGAPHLEELSLYVREISGIFRIPSTRLKSLCIGRQDDDDCSEIVEVCSMLEIWAPNLSSLVIFSRCYGTCLLHVPSLTDVVLNFFECGDEMRLGEPSRIDWFLRVFQSVRHAVNVTLSNWCIKFLVYMKKKYQVLVHFSNAECLNLYPDEPASEMLDVLDTFPNIHILTAKLQYAQKGESFASTTAASLHHLDKVEITWSVTSPSILRVIKAVLGNTHRLEKMVVRLRGLGDDEDQAFVLAQEKVLRMPRCSPIVEVIVIKD